MPRRIDLGRAVLLVGAALLLVSLFLEWYDSGPTGWQVFETLDMVLAALALAAIVAAVRPDEAPPWAAIALPAAVIVIVVVQLLDAPPAAAGSDPSSGAWLALAGGLLMAAGSALALASISVTVQVRDHEARRRVGVVDLRGEDGDDADPDTPPDDDAPSATVAAPEAPEDPVPPPEQRLGPRAAPRRLLDDEDRTQPFRAVPDEADERP